MISYRNFLLNTLTDIKLLVGFKPAIPMLRKQNERRESVLFGFEPGASWSYMAWHLQNPSTVQFTYTYMYIYICTHSHMSALS